LNVTGTRASANEIAVFDSIGTSPKGVPAAVAAFRRAIDEQVGSQIPFTESHRR
jgi:ornithine cyclodeaminase/alanine dehydrogenase-like protein (mu-crystallin family)